MDAKQAVDVLHRYRKGECTPEEKQLVEQWYDQLLETGEWKWGEGEKQQMEKWMEARLLKQINLPRARPVNWRQGIRWWPAAALLVMLAAGAYFWLRPPASQSPAPMAAQKDLPPGGNKAILTLSNGARIILDSAHIGQLASQGNSTVEKADSGMLVYNQSGNGASVIQYNTLRTPRGGQYKLALPDGSVAWLNAASSIRFPASFPRHERVVEITGEAYFEVARNANSPFSIRILSSNGTPKGTIQVLGTHFNINAYEDEPFISTTLLEGSVEISHLQRKVLLKPGEQAQLNAAGNISVAAVDTDEAVAWKNGEFLFNNANMADIMRQLSRWYNVEVSYKDSLNVLVNGSISRDVNIFQVLHILEQTGEVHFKINGNRIEVSR